MSNALDALIAEAALEAKAKTTHGLEAFAGAPAIAAGISFCQFWPTARPILVTLQGLIPKVAFLIAIVIAIGDKACPKH